MSNYEPLLGADIGGIIDTDRFSDVMRSRSVDLDRCRVLVADFRGSAQEIDMTQPPNCGGIGRIRHFRRVTQEGWPPNALPIDPACQALALPHTDILRAQVFQNAACNWRCWYCYVPYDRLSADVSKATWLTADEMLDRLLAESSPPKVIDLSGGQPDLAPEWLIWMMDALEARGVAQETYLWSDDNLSNDFYFRYLSASTRARVARNPRYGRVGCFKGFSEASFAFNTRAAPQLFNRQFELLRRLVEEGLDVYAYATFTTPTTSGLTNDMARFVDRLQAIHPRLPLRTVPLRIEQFAPVRARMAPAHADAIRSQDLAIKCWNSEIATRFSVLDRATRITDVAMR